MYWALLNKQFRILVKKCVSIYTIIYVDISSAFINDGNIVWCKPKHGVRQGCTVAPYLSLLFVEFLVIRIREKKDIKKNKINNIEIEISHLADFKIFSSLKVNIDKTKAFKSKTSLPFNLNWTG